MMTAFMVAGTEDMVGLCQSVCRLCCDVARTTLSFILTLPARRIQTSQITSLTWAGLGMQQYLVFIRLLLVCLTAIFTTLGCAFDFGTDAHYPTSPMAEFLPNLVREGALKPLPVKS